MSVKTALLASAALWLCALVAAQQTAPTPDQSLPSWFNLLGSQQSLAIDDQTQSAVHWRDFSAASFAEAAKLDKPVLLFVSAAWCQAGRQMERTTFADAATASLLNDDFVAIRMDRDQRPDADLRLQQALALLSGTRGYPLTLLLHSDGRPFYGGTQFPLGDEPALDQLGLRTILRYTLVQWRRSRQTIETQASQLEEALKKQAPDVPAAEPCEALFIQALQRIQERLDEKGGGFFIGAARSGPKFPAPAAIDLLLLNGLRHDHASSRQAALDALQAMARSAVFDQIGGGFHRCTLERWWRKPRFEKLLALNAAMLPPYLHAWQLTAHAGYRKVIEQSLEFWLRHSEATAPFFPGSVAPALSDNEENGYYTWTQRDFDLALSDGPERQWAAAFFGLHTATPFVERQVLYQAQPLTQLAAQLQCDLDEAERRVEAVRTRLLKLRQQRPAPPLDTHIYIDANALLAGALIECGGVLRKEDWSNRGCRVLDQILSQALEKSADGSHSLAHVLSSRGAALPGPALAHDEAALAHACALAYQFTRQEKYLQAADAALNRLDKNFRDSGGGYFDRSLSAAAEIPLLKIPFKAVQDIGESSTQGLIALASARLFVLTGRPEFSSRAQTLLKHYASPAAKVGVGGASLIAALDLLLTNKLPDFSVRKEQPPPAD